MTYPKKTLLVVICLVWLFITLGGYYIFHKPLQIQDVAALAIGIRGGLLAVLIITVAGGLGNRILENAQEERTSTDFIFELGLGLGLLALFWLLLGALNLFLPITAWLLLLAILTLTWRSCLRWLRSLVEAARDLYPGSGFARIAALLCLVFIIISLLEALAPPVRFDALVYHLGLPKDFIQSGGLTFTSENRYWGNPLLAEMLYTWAMLLGEAQAASALGWTAGIVSILGIGSLAQRYGQDSAWAAISAILVGETLWSSLAWAYADWFAILYGAAMLVTLDRWWRNGSARWIILSACMAGFAIGVKYPAGLALLGSIAALLIARTRKVSGRIVAQFLVVAAIVVSPWLIKNWLATGNPLYPYFGDSPWITAVEQSFFRGTQPPANLLMAILLPIRATLTGVEGAPGFSASIGPLLLGLLPGVLIGWKDRDDLLQGTFVFVLVGWLGWAMASMTSVLLDQSRIYFVIFPAWSLLAGFGYRALQDVRIRTIRLGRLAAALVLLCLSLASFQAVKDLVHHKTGPVLLGMETRESYLANRLGAYALAAKAAEEIEGEGTVVSLWEPRGFYCRPTCLPDVWIARWYVLRRTVGENDAVLEKWRDQGVTHLLLFQTGRDFTERSDPRFTKEDWRALDNLLGRLEPVERIGDAYSLYRLP